VTIIDPHVKVDEDYSLYSEAKKKGLLVRGIDGSEFNGKCWPDTSAWLDFLNQDTRDFIVSLYTEMPIGSSSDDYIWTDPSVGIWNDMNEPAVFNECEKTFPKGCIHQLR
jgi:alpha 1,3-glucosidase